MKIKKIILTGLLVLAMAPSVLAMSYKEAKAQNKPIVVYAYTKHCGACKNFAPLFDQTASKYSSKFNFVKELFEGSEICKRMKPSSVPAVYIVDPKTNKVKTINYDCASNKACFEGMLEKY